MSPDILLAQFERISDAPDAVARLRRFVLDLALRGKLVSQDPSDEPARVLLAAVRAQAPKGRKPVRDSESADAPFNLPPGWTWARFPELGIFGRGKSKHRPRNDASLFEDGTYPFVQTGDVARSKGLVKTFTSRYNDKGLGQSALWPKGTLCITIAANIADTGILGFDACFPDSVVGFIPAPILRDARYFEYFMRTARANLLEFAPATAQKNINLSILNELQIPLPPLNEQHRIVDKIDQLMALCDELEAGQTKRESRRDRLVAATLHGLNNGDSGAGSTEAFQQTAHFYFNHLPRLTTKPEHIRQLRQTILNLAVRGKLVPQDPSDEPADELVARIASSMGETSPKHDESSEASAAIPSTWRWISLGACTASMTNGIYKPAKFYSETGTACVRMFNIQEGRLDLTRLKRLDLTHDEIQKYSLEVGDLLVNRVNSRELVGKCALVESTDEPLVYEAMNIRVRLLERVHMPGYINLVMRTDSVRDSLEREAQQAVGQASINQRQLAEVAVPLPPLAEQHRIVAKVDELMALCDELERGLVDKSATCRALLEATLQGAIAG